MNYFLVPSNPKLYDAISALRELKSVEWRQSLSKIEIGDYVFIYLGKPYSQIKFRCIVTDIDIQYEDLTVDDNRYDLGIGRNHAKRYMRLKLDKEYADGEITIDDLRANGIATFQCQSQINDQLKEFLESKN